ncbi:Hypothetical protein PHPALM_17668 [Phytophthora palmivora]|uniref:Uncharacterized protein n=1 Tax=Phytophthora palmivora TaxID=4796 RepID=A0A2P4XLQ0_9STRA|nr:Hypothetical protein PHPALM_17668 [Phytophthora palmivora]
MSLSACLTRCPDRGKTISASGRPTEIYPERKSEDNVRDMQAQERYTLSKGTPETVTTKYNYREVYSYCEYPHHNFQQYRVLQKTFKMTNLKRENPYRSSKIECRGRNNNGIRRCNNNKSYGNNKLGDSGRYREQGWRKNRPLGSGEHDEL